jgi:hypothetical protein
MRCAQFKLYLIDDNIEPYQTNGAGQLLNRDNWSEVWNFHKFNPPGEYVKEYPEDLAIAHIIITEVLDGDGRKHKNNDTAIVKFGVEDGKQLLNSVKEKYNIIERLKRHQTASAAVFTQPLPQVNI